MKIVVYTVIAVQILTNLVFAGPTRTLTTDQLRHTPHLTAQQFAHYFADFKFKFHEEVQDHDVFLSTKSGDCDDYATVAADVLACQGYTPRMIAVRMKSETHVVCYLKECKGYLDYNCRKDHNPIVPCSPVITDIARKVALSFGHDWVATYEFTYEQQDRQKRLVAGIVANRDSREANAPASAIAGGRAGVSSPASAGMN